MANNVDCYVEHRLKEWANWYARNIDYGLGYPKRSIEGRLLDEGGYLSKSSGYKRELNHPAAEEIEVLIREMSSYNEELAKAIRVEYIKNNTQASKAKLLSVSLAQFKLYLKMAKAWLSGRLLTLRHYHSTSSVSYHNNYS
ncbi:MAG: hypothetical protein K0S11_295 [Gammaproteobacteria bacterium]|jgi:hypothetical protein|nr:hypothetical protein [Gammaproteobacteria bacterium]